MAADSRDRSSGKGPRALPSGTRPRDEGVPRAQQTEQDEEIDTRRERALQEAHASTRIRRSDAFAPDGTPRFADAGVEGQRRKELATNHAADPGWGVETTARSHDPLVGKMVGEYRVVERIGAGGMGIVYRAVHPLIGKSVAVKMLRAELGSDPKEMQRFIEEARTASAIGDRAIVDVFGFGRIEELGCHYLVMEYLNGEPLSNVLSDRGRVSDDEALTLLEEIAQGLSAAHKAGVVHRDLKPSNIFVVEQAGGGRYVKILDFGLAKRSAMPHGSIAQTRDLVSGTVGYMAPEQARAERIGPRADLYSLGVIAYEMFSGAPPFAAESLVALIMAHERETPRPLQEVVPGIRLEISDLVDRMLAKAPNDRPESAAAVAQELREIRTGQHAGVRPRPKPVAAGSSSQSSPLGAVAPETLNARPRAGGSKVVLGAVVLGVGLVAAAGGAWAVRVAGSPGPQPAPVSSSENEQPVPEASSPVEVAPAVQSGSATSTPSPTPAPPPAAPPSASASAAAAVAPSNAGEAGEGVRRKPSGKKRGSSGRSGDVDDRLLAQIRHERESSKDPQYLLLLNAAEAKALAGDPEAAAYYRELKRKFGR